MLADTHNAFGGLAASITQEIADEYSGKGVTVFGVVPPTFKQYVSLIFVNLTISVKLVFSLINTILNRFHHFVLPGF